VQAVAPDDVETVRYDGLGELPHFNPDLDAPPLPPEVDRLRAAVRAAGAVLFSTPEYAGTLPGSFKNLLDWTIGDDQPGSIYEKPVAWINSSSRDATGADETLRMVLGYAHATIVEAACAHIAVTSGSVDDHGLIPDVSIRERLLGSLMALVGSADGPDAPDL
jgi:NAD(P)H-dependent FMN reductase